jgi:hypothetical protein
VKAVGWLSCTKGVGVRQSAFVRKPPPPCAPHRPAAIVRIHADFAAIFVTFKVWLPHGVPPGCTIATKTPPQPTQAVLVALAAQTGPKVLSWAHTAAHG